MILGLAQMEIKWHNVSVNLEKCLKMIEEAAEKNVDFLVFPEMCLTGYSMHIEEFIYREEVILNWFKEKAKKYNINIGVGYAVRVSKKGENRFAIISRYGKVISIYSKIHPFSKADEDFYYNKGEVVTLAKVDEDIVSTFLCYDLRFPEIFQEASKNASIIVVSASWPDVRIADFDILLKARAIENQCFVVGINRFGYGNGVFYSGHSQIISPTGDILLINDSSESLLVQDIDLNLVKLARENINIKGDRRPELYRNFYI